MKNLILPTLHEDMTFFSWMSATQMMNGYPSAYRLSEILLGNGSAGTRLDFPSHLEEFCNNTSNAIGDVYSLSKKSTVLPYYLAFRPVNLIDSCVSIMAGKSVENLKFILGLPPTRINQLPNLKFCPDCFKLNKEELGFAYWHRSHQLPSSHFCTKHGQFLHLHKLREDGIGKNELAQPLLKNGFYENAPIQSLPLLKSLSNLSVSLLKSSLPDEFNANQLQFTYQNALRQHGLLTRIGKIKVSEFLDRLKKYFQPIVNLSPYERQLNNNNLPIFLKLLRKPRGFHHPVTHLLLIQFLFNSWELFCATYKWERQFQLNFALETSDKVQIRCSMDDNLQKIALRYEEGESLKRLANEFHYDIGTLMSQLEKYELVTIKRRPKKLYREIKHHVLDLLTKGHSINSISELTNLSKSTIDRILVSNPTIQNIRKLNKKVFMRSQKREKLVQYLNANPLTTKAMIKTSMSSTISWLSKNDNQWLNHILNSIKLPKVVRIRKTTQQRINWFKRDDECLKALQSIININLESWERRKPPAFLRRLPLLSFKPRLSNLPKSKAWVMSALENLSNSIS